MRIIKTKSYEEMSKKAANIIASVVTLKPDCMLGLATGSSPIGTYDELVKKYEAGDLDFSEVTTVNLDEYKGLPKENEQSYYYFMHEYLFDKVNINPEKTAFPHFFKENVMVIKRNDAFPSFSSKFIKNPPISWNIIQVEKKIKYTKKCKFHNVFSFLF